MYRLTFECPRAPESATGAAHKPFPVFAFSKRKYVSAQAGPGGRGRGETRGLMPVP